MKLGEYEIFELTNTINNDLNNPKSIIEGKYDYSNINRNVVLRFKYNLEDQRVYILGDSIGFILIENPEDGFIEYHLLQLDYGSYQWEFVEFPDDYTFLDLNTVSVFKNLYDFINQELVRFKDTEYKFPENLLELGDVYEYKFDS